MRTLRIVITMAGGVPLISATMQGCGGHEDGCPTSDATVSDTAKDRAMEDAMLIDDDAMVADTGIDTGPPDPCPNGKLEERLVNLPAPGFPAEPQILCQLASPVTSNLAARVSFAGWNPKTSTATGFIAVPSNVLAKIVGVPTIAITSASDPKLGMMQATTPKPIAGGFQFSAQWPQLPMSQFGGSINIKVTMTVSCDSDGGTDTVEATTPISYCYDEDRLEWVSAGDACTVCTIIAEMAPSPIISDLLDDGIPLARVIRIVVREIARAGRSVLLMAENDAGAGAEYEWRVSKGTVKHIAPDVVLWTLPEGLDRPFGQVAVMAETGAVVENFVWGGA